MNMHIQICIFEYAYSNQDSVYSTPLNEYDYLKFSSLVGDQLL